MSEFGITTTGFRRKELEDIMTELQSGVKGIFGDSINLSTQTPDGQLLQLFSAAQAELWQLVQDAYDAFNPKAARGVALSNLVLINGIERRPATASTVTLSMTGTDGTVIPAGSLVATEDGIQFATLTEVTIASGTGTCSAECTTTGPTPALAGTVTVITTAIAGWATVTNAADAVLGEIEESDAKLRVRRFDSVAAGGVSSIDSIRAGILALDGVIRCKIFENTANTDNIHGGVTDVPHSIRVIVEGGTATEIRQEIFDRKPAGIVTNGASTGLVYDTGLVSHLIAFDTVSLTTIKIKVTKTTYSGYPTDGDSRIKQAIVDYFASQLAAGYDYGIGDTVVSSRLYAPVVSVPGVSVTSILIAYSGTPTSSADLAINANARAVTSLADITVV